ncbi:hypothetical protein [Kitasatospora cathayae]|uniref:Serine/threonine protein kinase n=1 Tax=Kitasatospora cathayae TaxID=3004092 RepID=A0ABY7Q3P0_9ACTN|nr:hypothetical protein [Kitasatospora sp. HUAS 3-15]WBP87263.1 hypothetical protein O1G21_16365 [Kitasatospora sp. HUAS 3-15]
MSFEDRLGELFRDEDPHAAGPDPAAVIAGARRRRARRRVGVGAAALAVALVCGATAVTVGGARPGGDATAGAGAAPSAGAYALVPQAQPTPTPTKTALPPSPVRQVAVGEKVQVTDTSRMWVTETQRCDEQLGPDGKWYSAFSCRDVTSDNLDHSQPQVYCQGTGDAQHLVSLCFYLGPTPDKIILFEGGKPLPATLVTAPGMKNWTAFYLVRPVKPQPQQTAPVGWPADPIGVYDAQDRLLAESPGRTADHKWVHAPGATGETTAPTAPTTLTTPTAPTAH